MTYIKKAKELAVLDDAQLRKSVFDIIETVRTRGDTALKEYNLQFDNSSRSTLRVTSQEVQEAYQKVPAEEIVDIRAAAENIRRFATAQRDCIKELRDFEPIPGLLLGHRVSPVDSCCCYVPGGGYPLYSSALMLGIPAKVAGVKRVVACSPSMKNTGEIHPKTLVAMDVAEVDEIYAVGGAGAVAAFSYGTQEISPVDIIVGPGNRYVSEAKRQCYGKVGIDFIAGPSEVLIIADKNANAELIAADLLAQSEHDAVAKGILVALDLELGKRVMQAVETQLHTLETAAIARKSWQDCGEILVAENLQEAVDYSNGYAPEHLELHLHSEDTLTWATQHLNNYGSLFIGAHTAEVFGDYASGTNHTLPTVGAARYTGGVWVGTFLKICTHQRMHKNTMQQLAPLVSRLARGEGLAAHARAAEIRLKEALR